MDRFIIVSIVIISITTVHTSVRIGANMPGIVYYGRSQPYVDLVKQAHRWGTPINPGDGNATIDPVTGWPTEDFSVIFAAAGIDLGGAYSLYAKGNADVSLFENATGYITNKTYDLTTNTLTAVVNVLENVTIFSLTFLNTTGPGLQNISLLQPGFNLTSKSNITDLLAVHLSRFNIIRFMDWTSTNNNFDIEWNGTTPLDWPQYSAGRHIPWETVPRVANQINKPIDIWINIAVNVTDDYILNIARIMYNDLNPMDNIYLEYSNEVWNWGFIQTVVNYVAANDSVIHHGDPYHFNYDNCSNVWCWATRRTAYRIKHIADLFKTVFGEENVGQWKRVRPILAGWTISPSVIESGLDYLNAIYGPPSTILHGIAIAPYFDMGPYNKWNNLTIDQVLEGFNISIQQYLPEQGWNQKAPVGVHAVLAAWYKLPVYGYEGGPSTYTSCANCSVDAIRNATRDPRMTDICVKYLNAWYEHGFQELNWFGSGAGVVTQWGSWALLEDMRQEILVDTTRMFNSSSPVAQLPRPSPKLKAVDQIRQSTIQLNFGISVPATNVNATNFMNHQEPYPYPYIGRVEKVNSTFYYPFLIRESPMQLNITVYTSGDTQILEGSLNDDQFTQIQTPHTANRTTFAPAPAMQFNINQSILPSLVTFRLKMIETGYYIRSFDVIRSSS